MYGPQDYIEHLKKALKKEREDVLAHILVGAQDYPHYRQLIGAHLTLDKIIKFTLDDVHKDMAKGLGLDESE